MCKSKTRDLDQLYEATDAVAAHNETTGTQQPHSIPHKKLKLVGRYVFENIYKTSRCEKK